MIRRLQFLVVAVVLLIAAFSTGLAFLFYVVYLGLLAIGGSYVLTRFGLADLEAGYRVDHRQGHVGDDLRTTYSISNASRLAQAVAGGLQPDRSAGAAARPGSGPALVGPAILGRDRAADAARHVPHRADGRPDGRSVRLLRGGGHGRAGRRS